MPTATTEKKAFERSPLACIESFRGKYLAYDHQPQPLAVLILAEAADERDLLTYAPYNVLGFRPPPGRPAQRLPAR